MSNYRVYQIGTKFWLVDMATMTSFKMETVSKDDIIQLCLNAQNSGTPSPAQPPHPNSPKQKSAPIKPQIGTVANPGIDRPNMTMVKTGT